MNAPEIKTNPEQSTGSSRKKRKTRVDNVGDALHAVRHKSKNWSRHVAQYVYEYSQEHGLMWHLGYAENQSAIAQMQARMRVALPRDEKNLQKEVPAGAFVDLNGTKLLGSDNVRASKWNLGRATMPMPVEARVDGMMHPSIISLAQMAEDVGDFALTAINEDTGFSPLMLIARYPIKKREFAVNNQIRLYEMMAMAQEEANDYKDQLEVANNTIANYEMLQITNDERIAKLERLMGYQYERTPSKESA